MPRNPIDIRNKRLRGGRLVVEARTTNAREYFARKALLYDLIADSRFDLLNALRDGHITIDQLRAAQKTKTLDTLLATSNGALIDLRLSAFLDRILIRVKAAGVDGTTKVYTDIAEQLKAHFPDDMREVTREAVEDVLFTSKETTGRPWGRIRQEQVRQMGVQAWDMAIHAATEHAAKHGQTAPVMPNPFRAVKVAASKPSAVRVLYLERPQWRRIEETSRGLPRLALCALGALAGLRKGEAINLRPGTDIDLKARLIRVQGRKGKHRWRPKTPRSVRVVPINARLMSILTDHVDEGFSGDQYFLRLPGKDQPINESTAERWTAQAFTTAGIAYGRERGGLTNHSLRHTFASWLAQEDVQLVKIAALMGDTIETVVRYYAHLTPMDLERAAYVLDRTLEAP